MSLRNCYYTASRGFTLIELLIVVIVLGILASITVPQFSNAQESSLRASTVGQLQRVRTQIEIYRLDTGNDPDLIGSQWDDLVNGYITTVPSNPYTANPVAGSTVVGAAAPGAAWVWREKSATNSTMALYACDGDGVELVE